MKTSNNGIGFIRAHEGCKLNAYLDGGGAWTIGVGMPKALKKGRPSDRRRQVNFLLMFLWTDLFRKERARLCSIVSGIGKGN
ncbi:glycoside hydrolase family protein [Lelliottia amnigena]|uniref:glycoside hydrolase family protein n=1 Tax=Lelliottia amnigena TaxID=61646 RepID=UPI0039C8B0AD